MLQIIMAQEDILVKEKELESARRKLETIRKAKYKDRPMEYDSGSDF
jgi:talin